jgi:hypothetical protein
MGQTSLDVKLWAPWSTISEGTAAWWSVGRLVQDSYAYVEECEDFCHLIEIRLGQRLGSSLGQRG